MCLKDVFSELTRKNGKFFQLVIGALKFGEEPWSCAPSVIFIVFAMCTLHRLINKNLMPGSSTRTMLYRDVLCREIAFQWLYMYTTRGWFYVVKFFRYSTEYLQNFVLDSGGTHINVFFVQIGMFTIFCLLSIVPFLFTLIDYVAEGVRPNFLLWIPPNRWTLNELGTAGRLMERPPNVTFTKNKLTPAYHTKRSISLQLSSVRTPIRIRFCKSGFFKSPVSSLEEIIAAEFSPNPN